MKLIVQCILTLSVTIVVIFAFDFLPIPGGFVLGSSFSLIDALSWAGIPLFFGIVFGQGFRYVMSIREGPIELGSILGSIRNTPATYAAIFFSPIVLFGILATAQGNLKDLQTIALSFENGFFINHLMAVALKSREG